MDLFSGHAQAGKAQEHSPVNRAKSLIAWMAECLRIEVINPRPQPTTGINAIGKLLAFAREQEWVDRTAGKALLFHTCIQYQ